jgi:2-methylcitrate dehydratase PrpD
MITERNTVTRKLADWAMSLDHKKVPMSVRLCAQTCLIDTIGVAIAGSVTKVGQIALRFTEENRSKGEHSTPFGSNIRMSAPAAAFLNGTNAHALDFDDNCYAGFVHGSAVIVPAAFAMAQKVNASGEDLITAIVAGAECEYAIGAASNNILYDQGWWTTGVLGSIGACIASARLLQLTPLATSYALGLAISGTGGMKSCFGSDAKALMAGKTAEWGLVCAKLAQHGAHGPEDSIEANNGFINLFNKGQFDYDPLNQIGKNWFLQKPGVDIKRFPICLSSHAAIDAALQIINDNGLSCTDIESIYCDVPPIIIKNLIYERPVSAQQAQFSMHYSMAVSLFFGHFSLEHLDLSLIQGKSLLPLMSCITMGTGPIWNNLQLLKSAPEGAHITIKLINGKRYEMFKASARGSSLFPLRAAEIDDKFFSCVATVVGKFQTEGLLNSLKKIDKKISLRTLLNT